MVLLDHSGFASNPVSKRKAFIFPEWSRYVKSAYPPFASPEGRVPVLGPQLAGPVLEGLVVDMPREELGEPRTPGKFSGYYISCGWDTLQRAPQEIQYV